MSDTKEGMRKLKDHIKQSNTLSGVVKDALSSMGNLVCWLMELSNMQLCIERNELKDKKTIWLYGSIADTKVKK